MDGVQQVRVAVLLAGMNVAGIQRIRIALIREFVRRGIKVDVFCRDEEGPLRKEIPEEVRVYTGGKFGYFARLLRYINRERPTHIMSSYEDITLMAIAVIKVARHKPFLLSSTHNSLTDVQSEGGVISRMKYRVLVWLMRKAYKRADALVAVSKRLADDLSMVAHVPRDRIAVIYNPVTPRRDEVQDFSVQLPMDLPIVGFFGRLHPQKRVDLLVHAFARLHPSVKCRLCIFGEGRDEAMLKELVGTLGVDGAVSFHRSISNPYPAMEQCAVVVLPSDYEGFGNVLIEAMACGTQVISTDCRFGPSEILDGGRWGQLVPCRDVDSLSDAILRSLTGDVHVPSSQLKSRASCFSIDSTVEGYLAAMEISSRGTEVSSSRPMLAH